MKTQSILTIVGWSHLFDHNNLLSINSRNIICGVVEHASFGLMEGGIVIIKGMSRRVEIPHYDPG